MYDSLIDDRTGVISALITREIPDHFPAGFALTHAVLGDTARFSPWPADSTGAGYAFADPQAVTGAAIGEAAERYCGNLVPPELPVASYEQLVATGHHAIDPDQLCLYSPEQYAEPGFPASPLTRDRPMTWAIGRDLCTDAPVAVPASLVWVSWFGSSTVPRTPLTNPVIQAGLAAGPSRAFAETSALREVIERDAMTLCWYGGRGVQAVAVPSWLATFTRGPRDALSCRFLAFPTEFGKPVLGALVFDRSTGYLSLGAGVHDDPVSAALKAFGEALQLQLFLADLDDPAGGYAAAAALASSPLKPWRADRHYARSYRHDLRDVLDYGCHLQLHLDPDVQTRFLLELDAATTGELDLTDLAGDGEGGVLADRLARTGHRCIAVELTTPDVAAAGLHVTRMLVPGLYANSPIGMPFHGGTRLPAAWRHARVTVPTVPLPH